MAKTVLGLFDSFSEAQNAVEDLKRFGVRQESISLVARDAQGDATHEQEVGSPGAAEGAGAGAVGGTLVGGALGLLVGAGLLAIPGIGPVLAAGPLAASIGTIAAAAGATALGAGIGAAAGGLLGGLMGAGIPEDEAHAYVEGVRRGGSLLTVSASDVEADDVRQILLRNGAVDMDRRSDEWRAAGWGSPATGDNGLARPDVGDGTRREAGAANDDWQDSSKLGTTGGTVAGAATGAAIGAAGGPVGAVIGGVAGAATGAATGAAGDAAGERAEDGTARKGRSDNLPNANTDLTSESGRRSARYVGADEMGGAMGNMGAGDGSAQPGRMAPQPGVSTSRERLGTPMSGESSATQPSAKPRGGARIYDSSEKHDAATVSEGDALPAHGDFARGMRDQPATAVESDFARGMHNEAAESPPDHAELPAHGDFARGMRDESAAPVAPDFARGQRSFELYDNDFLAHYKSLTGAGGQPYDYYKPGYQFGFDMANDRSNSHDSWERAETDARQGWQRDTRGSWEEFKQSIRYGWEKARGQI